MDSEYQPISRVERLKAAHPWLLEAQAWKLLSIKYVLMGPDLAIHNPDHLELIMQEWTDHLVQMDDAALRQMCAWICLLYTSPSPRDLSTSRMPSSA